MRKEGSLVKAIDLTWQKALDADLSAAAYETHSTMLKVFESMLVDGWLKGETVKGLAFVTSGVKK